LQLFYARLPALPGAGGGADAKAWLSPQELEDRASVVFIRYQSALHKGNLAALNMFATPELLKSLGGTAAEKPQYRLAVGAVDVQGFAESQGLVKAWIRIRFSASENRDGESRFQERILVFSKSIHAAGGKGDLSCMSCPSCGGPIGSSDQAKCAYCENILSSPAANWVLSEYGGMELLSRLPAARAASVPAAMPSAILASAAAGKSGTNVQIRILSAIVVAALEDNAISEAEERTVLEFARHFGLGPIFVEMLLRKAKQDPAALAERLDMAVAVKWLNNLIMVAVADGEVSPEEEALLTSFARRHGIDGKHVRYALKAASKIQA
jgi:tellurite resistance protein